MFYLFSFIVGSFILYYGLKTAKKEDLSDFFSLSALIFFSYFFGTFFVLLLKLLLV